MSWADVEKANAAKNKRYWQDKQDKTDTDTSGKVDYWNNFINEIETGKRTFIEPGSDEWNQKVNELSRQRAAQRVPAAQLAEGTEDAEDNEQEAASLNVTQEPEEEPKSDYINSAGEDEANLNPDFWGRAWDRASRGDFGGMLFGVGGLLDPGNIEVGWNMKERDANHLRSIDDMRARNQERQPNYTYEYEGEEDGSGYYNPGTDTDYYLGGVGSPFADRVNGETNRNYADLYRRLYNGYELDSDDTYINKDTSIPVAFQTLNPLGEKYIDDGTADYSHLAASYMTGKQYQEYVKAGMGGRALEKIDPNATYNKMEEMNDHGFTPWIPDQDTDVRINDSGLWALPGQALSYLGDIRENAMNPTMEYDGKTIRNNDFESNYESYMGNIDDDIKTGDFDVAVTPQTFSYDFGNGVIHVGAVDDIKDNGDNTVELHFQDGTTEDVSMNWLQNYILDDGSFDMNSAATGVVDIPEEHYRGVTQDQFRDNGGKYGDYTLAKYNARDMILNDGQALSASDVNHLYNEADSNDIKYNNGPLDLGKPGRLIGDMPGGIGDVVPWTTDLIADNVGYMYWPATVGTALSNLEQSANGVQAGSHNGRTGATRMLGGEYDENGNLKYVSDEDKENMNALFGLLGPLVVEQTLGVGSSFLRKPLDKALKNRIAPGLGREAGLLGLETAGEAGEEMLGDVYEDIMRYGWNGAFANALTDENGNIIYDDAGNEIRDTSASTGERLKNYFNLADRAPAAAGGAGMALALNLPGFGPRVMRSRKSTDPHDYFSQLGGTMSDEELRALLEQNIENARTAKEF